MGPAGQSRDPEAVEGSEESDPAGSQELILSPCEAEVRATSWRPCSPQVIWDTQWLRGQGDQVRAELGKG